jgi:putative transcriptional regulator
MRRRRELAARNNVRLANHVKQHRARLDLTQEELATRVGVRRQTILAIEKGHYVPSTLLALLIASELGMSVDELFQLRRGEEGSP